MPFDRGDELYESIRRDPSDIEEIARHTGVKPLNIAKVKNHLFHEVHRLDMYEELGVPAVWARFDSDSDIAEAWFRLRAGTRTLNDLQLLRHEIAEAWHMRKHGSSYRLAHRAAQRRYPAPAASWS